MVKMLGAIVDTATSSINGVNLAIVFGAVVAYLMYTSVKKPPGMPPGPMTLPVIGNLLSFRSKPANDIFHDMRQKYGDLFSLKIGRFWVVVLNDIDLVRDSLIKKPVDFAGRPELFSAELMTENYKDIVFSPYSETWKLHRKLGHSAIRQFASSKKLEHLIQEVTGKMAERFDKYEGQPIDPKDMIYLGIYNILASLCFGETYAFDDPKLQFFIKLSKEGFDIVGQGFVADFIPICRYIPTPGVRAFKKLLSDYLGVLHTQFSRHRESYDPDNIRDISDALIQVQQEAIDEGSEHVSSLTDAHLVHTISDLFGAGTDTTIITLTWAVAIMTENPDIQKKCADEINAVIGRERFPCLQDRGSLPYSEATMMEVLRYSSIVPFSLPHTTSNDTTLRGYSIPKDTMVLTNLLAIHRDEKYWEEPEKFNPEHFLDETGTIRQHPNSFLPFSAGRRSCLGESLAKAELFLLFSWLLQNYEFAKVPGKEEEELIHINPYDAFGRMPKPYEVVVNKRSLEDN